MLPRLIAAALATAAILGGTPAAAQGPTPSQAAAQVRLLAHPPVDRFRFDATNHRLSPPDSTSSRKDHTVTGLLIGGALGFVAGWAFYNTLCEAVDNRCSDSRVGLVVSGTAIGAALGALAGSASDD